MFGGEYRHSMDAKNRLFIPAKMREELGETFVVAKSLRQNCLVIYSDKGWENYIEPIRRQARNLQERTMRLLNSNKDDVSPDSQGRIVILQRLAEKVGLGHNVVIVGCGDWAEIWSEEEYGKMIAEQDEAEIVSELESFGL